MDYLVLSPSAFLDESNIDESRKEFVGGWSLEDDLQYGSLTLEPSQEFIHSCVKEALSNDSHPLMEDFLQSINQAGDCFRTPKRCGFPQDSLVINNQIQSLHFGSKENSHAEKGSIEESHPKTLTMANRESSGACADEGLNRKYCQKKIMDSHPIGNAETHVTDINAFSSIPDYPPSPKSIVLNRAADFSTAVQVSTSLGLGDGHLNISKREREELLEKKYIHHTSATEETFVKSEDMSSVQGIQAIKYKKNNPIQEFHKPRKKAFFEDPKPSKNCHICNRPGERVLLLPCSNLAKGICRKVICEICFKDYGWNWEYASHASSQWTCSHCNGSCPKKAQCHKYNKRNGKLSVSRMIKKHLKMKGKILQTKTKESLLKDALQACSHNLV